MSLLSDKQYKSLIVSFSVACSISGALWSAIYHNYFGWTFTTLLPLLFTIIVGTTLLFSLVFKTFKLLVNVTLLCILWIPTLIEWQLGGIQNSGYAIMWGFLSVIGGFFFMSRPKAFIWLIMFVGNLLITVFLKPQWSSDADKIDNSFLQLFYFLNVFFPLLVVFFSNYFVNNKIEYNSNLIRQSVSRIKKLQTRSSYFNDMYKFLLNMSTRFSLCSENEKQELINLSLRDLGKYVNADRAYIFEYNWENKTTSNIYEWCNEGIKPELEVLQNISMDLFPEWVAAHKKKAVFYIRNVSELENNNLKNILQPQGIKSLIAMPIVSDNPEFPYGFIGFDSVNQTHSYSSKEKQLLQAYASLFFSLNKRLKNDKLLEKETKIKTELIKDIADSFRYAKRIQKAIFSTQDILSNFFKESFIFLKPKEEVSGDFYWLKHTDKYFYLAVVDCTGHGVPGAFMSILCNSVLNRALADVNSGDTGAILNKSRQLLLEEFSKSNVTINDGMDISMISIKLDSLAASNNNQNEPTEKNSFHNVGKHMQLNYSGANNPLWIIRANEQGIPFIDELKPNKQPVGFTHEMQDFVTQTVNIEAGSCLYLFTDGFMDQFGGKSNKKYKKNNFKNLLLQICTKSMLEQKKSIQDEFNSWKEGTEQTDDVCIIGLKI